MVELADVEEVLTLFCEGIAGRYLHIKSTREFSSWKLDLAENTPGQTRDALYLPDALEGDAGAYRVLALEQIGYRECGTFQFSLARAQERVHALGERAERSQVARGGDLTRLFNHFQRPSLARDIFLTLEYVRVMAHVFRRYPGIIAHANRYFALQLAGVDGRGEGVLQRARWTVMRAQIGRAHV